MKIHIYPDNSFVAVAAVSKERLAEVKIQLAAAKKLVAPLKRIDALKSKLSSASPNAKARIKAKIDALRNIHDLSPRSTTAAAIKKVAKLEKIIQANKVQRTGKTTPSTKTERVSNSSTKAVLSVIRQLKRNIAGGLTGPALVSAKSELKNQRALLRNLRKGLVQELPKAEAPAVKPKAQAPQHPALAQKETHKIPGGTITVGDRVVCNMVVRVIRGTVEGFTTYSGSTKAIVLTNDWHDDGSSDTVHVPLVYIKKA